MFLCYIGAVYLKINFILKEDNKEFYLKFIQENKTSLNNIELNLTQTIENKFYLFFKVNLLKIKDFIISSDYKFFNIIFEKEYINTINVSGRLTSVIENKLQEFFKLTIVKCGSTTKNSILGIDFLANKIDSPFFSLAEQNILNLFKVGHLISVVTERINISKKEKLYPYLLVNISEGVSVYRVDSKDKFQRVGGNNIGVSTYWGLVKLACKYDDPYVAVQDAIKGSNELIDLSVGDIYGGDYTTFGLDSSLLASSFGKFKNMDRSKISNCDISRSLLTTLCVNICLISCLVADIEKVDNVIIIGNALVCLEFMQMVQMSMNFFSKEKIKTLFSDYSNFVSNIGNSL